MIMAMMMTRVASVASIAHQASHTYDSISKQRLVRI